MKTVEAYKEALYLSSRARNLYIESLRVLAVRARKVRHLPGVGAPYRVKAIKIEKKATETKEVLIYDWSH